MERLRRHWNILLRVRHVCLWQLDDALCSLFRRSRTYAAEFSCHTIRCRGADLMDDEFGLR
jgi:hypothetical protein